MNPEDINSILEAALNLARASLKFENVEFVLEAKKDIAKVLADKNKLEQVFINTLLNAAQAMPGGGKVFVRSYEAQADEVKKGMNMTTQDFFIPGEKAVVVEIEDAGAGVSEENMGKMFEPFFTTKGPKGGSGLGLSVSRNIIQMHKGLIYLESQLGKGTKLTFVLKMAGR